MRIATLGPFTVPVDILFSAQDLGRTSQKHSVTQRVGMPRHRARHPKRCSKLSIRGQQTPVRCLLWTRRIIMSETRTHEWRKLCLEALSEPDSDRCMAIVV